MPKISIRQTSLRTIRKGDKKWLLHDGLALAPRAAFEISNRCPQEYSLIIQECIRNEWLNPVAHIKDHELFWEELQR